MGHEVIRVVEHGIRGPTVEKQDDDLRWLSNLDPTEQVGNTAEPPYQEVQSTPLPVLSEHQVSNLEGELETIDTRVVNSLTEDVFTE